MFPTKKSQVKLGFSTMGEVLIDGLGFSFGIESLGKPSDMGFLVTVSGDAVDKGLLKLDKLEVHTLKDGKFQIRSYGFKKVSKKDGGHAYQVAFKGVRIADGRNLKSGKGISLMNIAKRAELENELMMDRIANEVMFKFTPVFTEKTDSEALIAVFPYENIVNGAASQWVNVTSDRDRLKKKYGIKP